MTHDRDRFEVLENPDLCDLLTRCGLPADMIIEADASGQISIIDVDTHHWPAPPSTAELDAYIASVEPVPDTAWISHGAGLKLVYIGLYHRHRALAAAFCIASSFRVELLAHTRHPASPSSKHGGATCGPVRFPPTDPAAPYVFRAVGRLTPQLREEALNRLGLAEGQRYDHDRCPIDPTADTAARGCVVVLDGGVYCHRCANHGVRYREHLRAGFVPFGAIVGHDTTELDVMARERVHWTHARLVLRHRYPHISESLLREAYDRTLTAMYGGDDPRIPMVFDSSLDFVWGDGVWPDAQRLEPTRIDDDAISALASFNYPHLWPS